MFYRARDRFQRTIFNLLCRGIMDTPPLELREAPVCVVSLVSHRDLGMYLIAIKSLYRFLVGGRIVILSDGSLTDSDRAILSRHIPRVQILSLSDIPPADTPKAGCWERLLLISDLVRDSYVIQVDSDSLTLHEVPEVLSAVAEDHSFTLLGKGSFPAVESMLEACKRAISNGQRGMEPQGVAERSLDQFPDCSRLKYVRGTAAFTGFARASFNRSDVEFFSRNMERICGRAKWHEWGSEQVTSNLIIANSRNPQVLQHPKYTSYYALPEVDYSQSSFIHFIGTYRYKNCFYSSAARHVITELNSNQWKQGDFDQCTAVGCNDLRK